MATHTFYGYSASALNFDAGTGDVTLTPGYDFTQDRVRFEVTDNDNFADGDASNDEVGDDTNQVADIFNTDGSLANSGQIYVEEVLWLENSDGDPVSINVFEINGQVVGYIPSEPLNPGETYTFTGTTDAGERPRGGSNNLARNNYSFYENNSVACFGPGTMIATQEGDMPVEWLETSDKVLTRDHGFQSILWIGRSKLPAGYFRQYPEEAPVRIPAGALGPSSPTHDLTVTGDHRPLIQSAMAELMFSSSEVLAPAKSWVDAGSGDSVRPTDTYTITHILCATHQIIAAQGAWVESMFTGDEALRRLSSEKKRELEQRFPGALNSMKTARTCLTRREAAFLLKNEKRHSANTSEVRRLSA